MTDVFHRLKFLNAITAFTSLTVFLFNHLQPTKSIYIEPVQGSNLNRRYISGLEPEMPVTLLIISFKLHWWSNLSWHGPRTNVYENVPVVAVILDTPVQAYHHRPCKGMEPYFAGSMSVANQTSFVFFLLGDSPASEFYTPTFRNTLFHLHRPLTPPMKMEQCSDTSAYKIQTPGNHPKERIQHSDHGESLKSKLHLPIETSLYDNVTSRCLNQTVDIVQLAYHSRSKW